MKIEFFMILTLPHLNFVIVKITAKLQTVVIEQSDELDRSNCQLDLVKQMKHNCLLGDLDRCKQINTAFNEQSEQLIEICKMLNQIAPTNKMKITTKTLAIWFDLNIRQLLHTVSSLCENPSSKELKDCAWAYLQGNLTRIPLLFSRRRIHQVRNELLTHLFCAIFP